MAALIVSMFTLGLVTSVHCVSMCGPMVVTYAVKGTQEGVWYRRLTPHAAYHGARFASYAMIGLLLGAVGSMFNLDAIRPYVMFAAGAFMIVLGLGMTGRARWAQRLTPKPPRFLVEAISRTRRKANSDAKAGDESLATPVTFGLLTGLMPCAPLMGAELTAAATGSAIAGAAGMLAFGVGTAPLMVAFGTCASLIPQRFKQRMNLVLAIVVICFGVVFFNRALMLVGSPVSFNAVQQAFRGSTAPLGNGAKVAGDGVVEVALAIVNTEYVPSRVVIPANQRVRLVVDRKEDVACSDQLAVPKLGVLADLAPNATTKVELPPTKPGTYTLTCGMGMMSGSLVAVESTSAPPGK